MSAKDHAIDLAVNNIFGHTGSDRSLFSERILRYCKKGQGAMVELIGADWQFFIINEYFQLFVDEGDIIGWELTSEVDIFEHLTFP